MFVEKWGGPWVRRRGRDVSRDLRPQLHDDGRDQSQRKTPLFVGVSFAGDLHPLMTTELAREKMSTATA
jgi:hypothetical protein